MERRIMEEIKSVSFRDYNNVTDIFIVDILVKLGNEEKTVTYMLSSYEIETLLETPDGELTERMSTIKHFIKSYDLNKVKNQLMYKDFPTFND